MNAAIARDSVAELQALFAESDIVYDPQALVLAPDSVIRIADAYVGGSNALDGTVRAVESALGIVREALSTGRLQMTDREAEWIPRIEDELATIPRDEGAFVDEMQSEIDTDTVILSEYGL
jgi:hypothetical protein